MEQIPLRPDSPPFMGGLLGPRAVRVSGMAETERAVGKPSV